LSGLLAVTRCVGMRCRIEACARTFEAPTILHGCFFKAALAKEDIFTHQAMLLSESSSHWHRAVTDYRELEGIPRVHMQNPWRCNLNAWCSSCEWSRARARAWPRQRHGGGSGASPQAQAAAHPGSGCFIHEHRARLKVSMKGGPDGTRQFKLQQIVAAP
jgi:hypothetical protein